MRRAWVDRPTLVTGATGLLGSWLVPALLERGADVVVIVRDWVPGSELVRSGALDRIRVVRGDVEDQALVERVLGEYEVETVFHLAAQTLVGVASRNPASTFETNVAGTWRLLEACRRSPRVGAVVFASSDKAYGEQAALPYTEEAPLAGRFPYDASKSCGDLVAQSFAATYHLPVSITRCGNLYGGGDLNWSRIVPGTVRSVVRGEDPVLRSDGKAVRDYFYVEDAVGSYLALAEALAARPQAHRGQAYNFSNEEPVAALELVQRILKVMESDATPVVRADATHEIQAQFLSAAKARAALGWAPAFTLEEGLARTVRWYEDYLGGRRAADDRRSGAAAG